MLPTHHVFVLLALISCLAPCGIACTPLAAQDASTVDRSPQLGDLTFPTSGSPAAQKEFLIAVKLLHNFEYEEAVMAFQRCQEIDPPAGIAYWGEAMCYNHPLWGEQNLESAQAVLQRWADVVNPKLNEREAGFLATLDILYGPGEKSERDRAYSLALQELSSKFPDDDEVTCFQALALLGTCAGNRDARIYMQAAGILEEVFRRNPRHPGVLHYLIHCYDDPVHAPLGLRAARTYGAIAGNSAHAQHMPSHIYLPLGMWSEVIQSNEKAWQAGHERLKHHKHAAAGHDIHALHALQWLQYGYLQTADYDRAFQLLQMMADIHRDKPTPMSKWYFALMRAAYVVDAPDWSEATMAIEMQGVELSATACNLFASGLAAIRNDTTGAERILQELKTLRGDAERQVAGPSHNHSSYFEGVFASSIRAVRVIETQLEALILLGDGHDKRAVERLRDAVAAEERLPTGYGPPLPVKPSTELLGDVLLHLARWDEAQDAFEASLQRTPGRTASLVGLAEAARKTGDSLAAKRTNDVLSANVADRSPYRGWVDLRSSE